MTIIDREGIDALSIRRLGSELNVNGVSLYHHFKNKEAILVGAAELALEKTPIGVRPEPHSNWQDWLLDGARQLRDVLRAHPGLLPIIVQLRTLGVHAKALEHITGRLIEYGVPRKRILSIFDALERYVVGSVTRDVDSGDSLADRTYDRTTHPSLHSVATARDLSEDELFDCVVLGIIESVRTAKPGAASSSGSASGRKAAPRRRSAAAAGKGPKNAKPNPKSPAPKQPRPGHPDPAGRQAGAPTGTEADGDPAQR